MKKIIVPALIFTMICVLFSACGNSPLTITVSNRLDYDVSELYINSANADSWGLSVLEDTVFGDNKSVQVSLEPTDSATYNVMAIDAAGDYYYFYDLPLSNGAAVELVSTDEWYDAVVTQKKGDPLTIKGDFEFGYDEFPEDTAPTPDDPLDVSVIMPGCEDLVIPYPSTMKVANTDSNNHYLQFDAVSDPDHHQGISFNLISLKGTYDELLSSSSTVQETMIEIVGKICEQTFPGMLINSNGTVFVDGGTYFSVISYLWMSGEVFEEATDTPVRGVLECRYYGHTGYVLASFTLADEGVMKNYFDISTKIFNAISFGDGWTTPTTTNSGIKWSAPGDYEYDPWSDCGNNA